MSADTEASSQSEVSPLVVAYPVSNRELRVVFRVPIDLDSARRPENYRLDSGLEIGEVRLHHNRGSEFDGDDDERLDSDVQSNQRRHRTRVTLTTEMMNGDLMDFDVLRPAGVQASTGDNLSELASPPFLLGIASIPQTQRPNQLQPPFTSRFNNLIATESCQKDGGPNSSHLIDTLGFSFLHVERGGPFNSIKVVGRKHVPGIVEEVERLRPQGLSPHILWSGGQIRTISGETRLVDTGFMEGSILPATPKHFPPPFAVRTAELTGDAARSLRAKRLQGVIVLFSDVVVEEVDQPQLYRTGVRGPAVRRFRFQDDSGSSLAGVLLDTVQQPIESGARFESMRAIVHQPRFGEYEAIVEMDEHLEYRT
jgi:hypothetical protein